MKAKRLTALALAALMAASTTSVALASAKADYDLDFKKDGYYKYDEDEGRIVPADRDDLPLAIRFTCVWKRIRLPQRRKNPIMPMRISPLVKAG